jgi:hypothetical protein
LPPRDARGRRVGGGAPPSALRRRPAAAAARCGAAGGRGGGRRIAPVHAAQEVLLGELAAGRRLGAVLLEARQVTVGQLRGRRDRGAPGAREEQPSARRARAEGAAAAARRGLPATDERRAAAAAIGGDRRRAFLHSPKWSSGKTPFSGGLGARLRGAGMKKGGGTARSELAVARRRLGAAPLLFFGPAPGRSAARLRVCTITAFSCTVAAARAAPWRGLAGGLCGSWRAPARATVPVPPHAARRPPLRRFLRPACCRRPRCSAPPAAPRRRTAAGVGRGRRELQRGSAHSAPPPHAAPPASSASVAPPSRPA